MTVEPRSQRLLELDILRSLAIVLIFLFHVPYNLNFASYEVPWDPHSQLYIFGELLFYLETLGIGLFFFVSGYAIDLRNNSIASRDDVKTFFVKRAKRIFPLYWLALLVTFGVPQVLYTFFNRGGWQQVNLSPSVYIFHFLGLQVLVAPRFLDLVLIWFVGAILLYYLLYPIIIRQRSRYSIVINAVAIFLVFSMIRLVFDVTEFRFFLYYFIFIAGVLAQRSNLFQKRVNKSYAFFAAIALCASVIIFHISGGVANVDDPNFGSIYNVNVFLNLIWINAIMLLFIYVIVSFVRYQSKRLNQRTHKYFYIIAYATYAIFLFHVDFILVLRRFFEVTFGLGQLEIAIIVIVMGFPLIAIFSFYLQRLTDKLINNLSARFSAN